MRTADVHAGTVKVHLVVVRQRLGRRDSGWEGRARGRVVVGTVERRGQGVWVEHVRVGGAVVHHGRADGREAKVLLEGARRVYDGVLVVHLEGVDGEGHLGLRGREGGR